MGFYLNPGNENFRFIVNDEYIDKSGLISVIIPASAVPGGLGNPMRQICLPRIMTAAAIPMNFLRG